MNISKKTLLLLSFVTSMNAHEASQEVSLQRGVSLSDSALGEDPQMRVDDSDMSSDNEELASYFFSQQSSSFEDQTRAVASSVPMEQYRSEKYADLILKIDKLGMGLSSLQRSSTPAVAVRKREALSQDQSSMNDDSDNEDKTEHFKRAYKRKKR